MNDPHSPASRLFERTPVLRRPVALSAVVLTAATLAAPSADACTSALVERGDERRVVKSFDWHDGRGYVFHNPAGPTKRALVPPPNRALTWTAKHASLTFNQHGPGQPLSGMNDAGLVVETLWLRGTEYPDRDQRPAVNELQLVQWLLDSFSSTDAALRALPTVRVAAVAGKVHWLVCDRRGACASIEYLDGKLTAHSGKAMKRALTNHPHGDEPGLFAGRARRGSQRRFETALRLADARTYRANLKQRCDDLLGRVQAGRYTKWQLIWDPKALRVHFVTDPGTKSAKVRSIALNRSVKRCSSPRAYPLAANDSGDVTAKLGPVDRAATKKQVTSSLRRVGVRGAKRLASGILANAAAERCGR